MEPMEIADPFAVAEINVNQTLKQKKKIKI